MAPATPTAIPRRKWSPGSRPRARACSAPTATAPCSAGSTPAGWRCMYSRLVRERVVGEDGEGAVELFERHQTGQFVGKGERRERYAAGGRGAHGGIKTVGAADGEEHFLRKGRRLAFEKGGEGLGRKAAAGGVKEPQPRTGSALE